MGHVTTLAVQATGALLGVAGAVLVVVSSASLWVAYRLRK